MTRISLALSLVTLPLWTSGAFADEALDRYAAANDAKAEQMIAFYRAKAPELEPVLPAMAFDDELATIATCILDGVRAERGEDGVNAYLDAMEEWGAIPVTSFAGMAADLPDLLGDPLAQRLSMDCGALDLGMRRMQESGMLAKLQDPAVVAKLMAE